MTNTYDTAALPIGTASPKALFNNASNLDDLMLGPAPAYPDRKGKRRQSWAGMEQAFQQFLVNTGFETAHLVYVDGSPLVVSRPTQLIDRAGLTYRVKLPASFPVNLIGNWATDSLALVDVTDTPLRQSLADAITVANGAAMVGRAVQVVTSIAQLRTLLKTVPSKQALMVRPGVDAYLYSLDQADITTADNNGNIIVAADGGRWKIAYTGTVSPKMWGAVGDGVADDTVPVQAAINFIRSVGGGTLDSGTPGTSYSIASPLKLYSNMSIIGFAYFIARVGFTTAVTFPTYSNPALIQTYNTLMYFNDGTAADDPTNFGYRGLTIESTVELYGNYNCEDGVILEGITNYRISARIQRFNSVGVWAKYYAWGGRINAHITSCRTALIKMGEAANGIDFNGLQAYGDADTPTFAVQIVGDNNGVNFAGAFIEKMVNGIYWDGFSGPASISGVDFEDCTTNLITVDGTGLVGRAAGPVVITGSFLEAGSVAVRAINAVVEVIGCRIRDTPLAFSTTDPMARITHSSCQFENVGAIAQGNVIGDEVLSNSRKQTNRLPNPLTASVESYGIENKSYSYNQDLMVNGLNFTSIVADVPTQRMLSTSTWETRELRNGLVFGVMGLSLDYSLGLKNVVPRGDNDHTLGTAALRFSTVYAGTGTINTSDARLKTKVRKLSKAEIAASRLLGNEIGAFQFLDAVANKGKGRARAHIGMTVQRAIQIMRECGLEPLDYGFICHDEWVGGDSYGFRMDELLAFIAAGFAARLEALER